MILYPSRRGFIVESGVPRTRTCRSRRAAALPPPAGIRSFTCWSEHETEVAADGRRACEWATVLWSAAPLFFSLIGMQAEAGQSVSAGEERRKREGNNRREKGPRFESGLRNRTPAGNSWRNLICRSVNHRPRNVRVRDRSSSG